MPLGTGIFLEWNHAPAVEKRFIIINVNLQFYRNYTDMFKTFKGAVTLYRTWIGFELRLRLVSDLQLGFTLDWSSSGLWVKCDLSVQNFGQNITKQAAQLFHHSNQPISSPNSVWLRSIRIRIQSEFFLNPPRLGGLESSPNSVQIQPKSNHCFHTCGLAIQILSKSNPSPLVWTHLKKDDSFGNLFSQQSLWTSFNDCCLFSLPQEEQWVGTVILNGCEIIERPSKKEGFCFKIYHPLQNYIWATKVTFGTTFG